MAVTDITRCRKRVLEILLASVAAPGDRYSGAATGNSLFAVTQEITDAILEADAIVCTLIINTVGHPYRSQFLTAQDTGLANGALLSAHVGSDSIVKVDNADARLAESRERVLELVNHVAVYPLTTRYYFIEDRTIYHTGAVASVLFPAFTKTSACQAPENYEAADIAGAVTLLPKQGVDPDVLADCQKLFELQQQLIQGKDLIIPQLQQFERAIA